MRLITREYISNDWSEMLTPKEGVNGEIVVAHGKIISKTYGIIYGIIGYDLDTESVYAMAKYDQRWECSFCFGENQQSIRDMINEVIKLL